MARSNGKPATHNLAFGVGIARNISFIAVEAIYGIRAHSIALVADSGHNLSDVLGLVLAWGASFLAWGASFLARRLPSIRFTYGLRRWARAPFLGSEYSHHRGGPELVLGVRF